MKILCIISAFTFVVLFAALNLFLPYAVLVLVLAVAIGFPSSCLGSPMPRGLGHERQSH